MTAVTSHQMKVTDVNTDVICALNSCKICFGNTHNCLSFKWDSASGCIDMMPFLLRSLYGVRETTNMDQAHL